MQQKSSSVDNNKSKSDNLLKSSFAEEEEEEENMRLNDSQVVSVFRLKLLEAQFQESLYEVTKENSNFEGQIAQDLSENKDFVSEMDHTIDEVQKWRVEYAKTIQQEYADMKDSIDRDNLLTSEKDISFPETIGMDEESPYCTTTERPNQFDECQHESLQMLIHDMQKEMGKENDRSSSDNQDRYHNANVDLNRIEYEAREESLNRMELLKKKFLLSEKEIDNDMNGLNHALAATSFELDEILSKIG